MRKLLFLPLFLLAMGQSCSDSDLDRVAKSLNTATKTVGGVQDAVIAAHDTLGEEVFPKDDADAIVAVCKEVQMAIVLANNLTRNYTEMPEGGRDNLLDILVPVIEALEIAASSEKLSIIIDNSLRSVVSLGLNTALGVMRTAQTILEVNDAN